MTTIAYVFMLFHVFVCSLLLPCMLKSIALRVGLKTLYNTMTDMGAFNYNEDKVSSSEQITGCILKTQTVMKPS